MRKINNLDKLDIIILVGIIFFTFFYALLIFSINTLPFEDAAILMRYSKNLADGHGIVWNIGENPVDGATDFLFMIFVALIFMTGISLELSVLLISYTSHILTVIIIYLAIRTFYMEQNGWL